MIPAGAIRKRAIIRQFLEAGAVSEETARTPEEAGVFQGLGIKFDQLVERGVLVPCAGGRYRSVYKELHADHETGAADNK